MDLIDSVSLEILLIKKNISALHVWTAGGENDTTPSQTPHQLPDKECFPTPPLTLEINGFRQTKRQIGRQTVF